MMRPQPLPAARLGRRRTGWRRRVLRVAPLFAITLAIVLGGLALRAADPGALGVMRNLVFDEYQRQDPRPYDPNSPVRIVAIDEASLDRLGQWPWPRATMAQIVSNLHAKGAAAIGIDVLLAEPDRMSPENLPRVLPAGEARETLAKAMEGLPRNDARLATALVAAPSVLGVALSDARAAPETDGENSFAAAKAGFAFAGDDPRRFLPAFSGATAPLPVLAGAAAGLGALNWLPDRDRVVRKVPLVYQLPDGAFLPGLAAEALRVAQGASTYVIRASNASGQSAFGAASGVNAVRVGALEAQTSADGSIRLHFAKTPRERQIPAWWVTEGVVPTDEVAGRIILIGATASGLLDIQATPLEAAVPGVEIHAQLIDHIVFGNALSRPDWAAGLEVVVFVALALLFCVAAATLSPLIGVGLGLIVIAATGAGSFYLFCSARLLVDPSFPILGSALALLATTAFVAVREGSERRWVRSAFGRYVAADLVEDLAQNPDRLTLGGEIRDMTILFTDIRGFTTISEGMNAQDLTAFINAFLTPLTNVILSHRGTVDKYMGDAIMAFWNAPLDDEDHAKHAAETALSMMVALEAFNVAHAGVYKPVSIGIGLNTGECCVGNLGSDQRFDYSVIGDDVNVASRLEGQTKTYGVPILVGPRTAAQLAGTGYATLRLDSIKVKGKDNAIDIFALTGGPNHAEAPAFAKAGHVVAQLVDAFHAGDLTEAAAALAALDADDAADLSAVREIYRERLKMLTLPAGAAADPPVVAALKETGSEAALTRPAE
ncbi:MAG: adenylate/guanylate cyclase domain-containing protein [Pseudomonadota bacterium]